MTYMYHVKLRSVKIFQIRTVHRQKTLCLWTVVIWIILCNISDIFRFFLITRYHHPPYLLPSVTSTSSIIPLCAIGAATTLTGQVFWWSWSKEPPKNARNQLSRYETPVKQFGMDLAILSYFCHIGLKSERHQTKTCINKALAHLTKIMKIVTIWTTIFSTVLYII